jgi:hypothetical protein
MTFDPLYAKNNAYGILYQSLPKDGTGSDELILESYSSLPVNVDQYKYHFTLTDSTNEDYSEIVEPTSWQVDNQGKIHYWIERGKQDTAKKLWPSGTLVKLNVTAKAINELNNETLRVSVLNNSFDARLNSMELNTIDSTVTKELTGFPNLEDSEIEFNDTQLRLEISPVDDEFSVYVNNQILTYTETVSVEIDDIEGLWYFYFNSNGLQVSRTEPKSGCASVATIYWNSDINECISVCDERHGVVMDWATQKYIHDIHGSTVTGFSIEYNDIDELVEPSDDNACRIILEGGYITDEDITFEVINTSDPNDSFEQFLGSDTTSNGANIPIYYLDGSGNWRKANNNDGFPFLHAGANSLPLYNHKKSNGQWETKYLCEDGIGPYGGASCSYWIAATNDQETPIISIMGQEEYLTTDLNESYDLPQFINQGNYPFPEIKILYRIIIYADPTWTGPTHRCKIANVTDFRYVNTKNLPFQLSHHMLHGLNFEESEHSGFQKQPHFSTRKPNENDDEIGTSTDNTLFHEGMWWYDTSTDKMYFCKNSTDENALWENIPTSKTGHFTEDVNIDKDLNVLGNMELTNNILIKGNTDIYGDSTNLGNFIIDGNTTIKSNLSLNEDKLFSHGINNLAGGIASVFEYHSTIPGENDKKMISWYETDTDGNIKNSDLQLAALTAEGKFITQSGLFVTPNETDKSIHLTHDSASTTAILQSSDFDGNLEPLVILSDPLSIYGNLISLNGAEFHSHTLIRDILTFHDLATMRFNSHGMSMVFDYQFDGIHISAEDETSSSVIVDINNDGDIRVENKLISSPNYGYVDNYKMSSLEFSELNNTAYLKSIDKNGTLYPLEIQSSNYKNTGNFQFTGNGIFDGDILFDGSVIFNESTRFTSGTPLKFSSSFNNINMLGIDSTTGNSVLGWYSENENDLIAFLEDTGWLYLKGGLITTPDVHSVIGSIYYKQEETATDGLYITAEDASGNKKNIILDADNVIIENSLQVNDNIVFDDDIVLATGKYLQFGKSSFDPIDGLGVGYFEDNNYFGINSGLLKIGAVDSTGNFLDEYIRFVTNHLIEIPARTLYLPPNDETGNTFGSIYNDGNNTYIQSLYLDNSFAPLNIQSITNFEGSVYFEDNIYLKKDKYLNWSENNTDSIISTFTNNDAPEILFYSTDSSGNIFERIASLDSYGNLVSKSLEINYNTIPYDSGENSGALLIDKRISGPGVKFWSGNELNNSLYPIELEGSRILISGNVEINGDFSINGEMPWNTGGTKWPFVSDGTSSYIYYETGDLFNVLARYNEEYTDAITWNKTNKSGVILDTYAILGEWNNNNIFAIDGKLMAVLENNNTITREGSLSWNDTTDRLELTAYDHVNNEYKELHLKASRITTLGDVSLQGPLGLEPGYGLNFYGSNTVFEILYSDKLVNSEWIGELKFGIEDGNTSALLKSDGTFQNKKLIVSNTTETNEERRLTLEYSEETDLINMNISDGTGYLFPLQINSSRTDNENIFGIGSDLEFTTIRENNIKFFNNTLVESYINISGGLIDSTTDDSQIRITYNDPSTNEELIALFSKENSVIKNLKYISKDDNVLFKGNKQNTEEYAETKFIRYEDDNSNWGLFINALNKKSSTPETRITLNSDKVKIYNLDLYGDFYRRPDTKEIFITSDNESLQLTSEYDEDVLIEESEGSSIETKFGYLSYNFEDSVGTKYSGARITPWGIVSRKQLQISEDPYDDAAFASDSATATFSISEDELGQKNLSITTFDFNLDEYYSTYWFTSNFNVIGNLRVTGTTIYDGDIQLGNTNQIIFNGDEHDLYMKYDEELGTLYFESHSLPQTLFTIGRDRVLSRDFTVIGFDNDVQMSYPPDYIGGGTIRYNVDYLPIDGTSGNWTDDVYWTDGTNSYSGKHLEIISHIGNNPDSNILSDILITANRTVFDTDITFGSNTEYFGENNFYGNVNFSGDVLLGGNITFGEENTVFEFSGALASKENYLDLLPNNNNVRIWNNLELKATNNNNGIKTYLNIETSEDNPYPFSIEGIKLSDTRILNIKNQESNFDFIRLDYTPSEATNNTYISGDYINLISNYINLGLNSEISLDINDNISSLYLNDSTTGDNTLWISFNKLDNYTKFYHNLIFDGTTTLSGSINLDNIATFSNNAIFNYPVNINSDLIATGDITLNDTTADNLYVINNSILNNVSTVGILNSLNELRISDSENLNSLITYTTSTKETRFVSNDGTSELNIITFDLENGLTTFENDISISGNNYVNGNSTFNGPVTFNSTFTFTDDFKFGDELQIYNASFPNNWFSISTNSSKETLFRAKKPAGYVNLIKFDLDTGDITLEQPITFNYETTVNEPITFNDDVNIGHGLNFFGELGLKTTEHNHYLGIYTKDSENKSTFVAYQDATTYIDVLDIDLTTGDVTLKQDFNLDKALGLNLGTDDIIINNKTVELTGDVILDQKLIWNDSTTAIDGFYTEFSRGYEGFISESNSDALVFYYADGTNNMVGSNYSMSGDDLAYLNESGKFYTRNGFTSIYENPYTLMGFDLGYDEDKHQTKITSFGDALGTSLGSLNISSLYTTLDSAYLIHNGLFGQEANFGFTRNGKTSGTIGTIAFFNEDIENTILTGGSPSTRLIIEGLVDTTGGTAGELSIHHNNFDDDIKTQLQLNGWGLWKFGPNDSTKRNGIVSILGSNYSGYEQGGQLLLLPSNYVGTNWALEQRIYQDKFQIGTVDISGGNNFIYPGDSHLPFFEIEFSTGNLWLGSGIGNVYLNSLPSTTEYSNLYYDSTTNQIMVGIPGSSDALFDWWDLDYAIGGMTIPESYKSAARNFFTNQCYEYIAEQRYINVISLGNQSCGGYEETHKIPKNSINIGKFSSYDSNLNDANHTYLNYDDLFVDSTGYNIYRTYSSDDWYLKGLPYFEDGKYIDPGEGIDEIRELVDDELTEKAKDLLDSMRSEENIIKRIVYALAFYYLMEIYSNEEELQYLNESNIFIGDYSGYGVTGNNIIGIGRKIAYNSYFKNSIGLGFQTGYNSNIQDSLLFGSYVGGNSNIEKSIIMKPFTEYNFNFGVDSDTYYQKNNNIKYSYIIGGGFKDSTCNHSQIIGTGGYGCIINYSNLFGYNTSLSNINNSNILGNNELSIEKINDSIIIGNDLDFISGRGDFLEDGILIGNNIKISDSTSNNLLVIGNNLDISSETDDYFNIGGFVKGTFDIDLSIPYEEIYLGNSDSTSTLLLYTYNLDSDSGTDLVITASDQIVKATSSIKYKENVSDIEIETNKIFNLRPVSFNYKNKTKRTFGLIAEEVIEEIPELVNLNENQEPESVDYKKLSVLLLEEVKKLRKEVDELKRMN